MSFQQLSPRLRAYILGHGVLLAPVLWMILRLPSAPAGPLTAALLLATAAAGSWKVELTIFQGRLSVVFAIVCLAAQMEGPRAAVACAALGALVTTLVRS